MEDTETKKEKKAEMIAALILRVHVLSTHAGTIITAKSFLEWQIHGNFPKQSISNAVHNSRGPGLYVYISISFDVSMNPTWLLTPLTCIFLCRNVQPFQIGLVTEWDALQILKWKLFYTLQHIQTSLPLFEKDLELFDFLTKQLNFCFSFEALRLTISLVMNFDSTEVFSWSHQKHRCQWRCRMREKLYPFVFFKLSFNVCTKKYLSLCCERVLFERFQIVIATITAINIRKGAKLSWEKIRSCSALRMSCKRIDKLC